MSNLDKSAYLGGIYAKLQRIENTLDYQIKHSNQAYLPLTRLAGFQNQAQVSWEKIGQFFTALKRKFTRHFFRRQDLYLAVLISLLLLVWVFWSKTAFSKTPDRTSVLPIKDSYNVKLISLTEKKPKICQASANEYSPKPAVSKPEAKKDGDLKEKVAGIVKNTPMSAMVDSISQKPKPVAAFIVGIAMKESKFGVYSPKLAGRDCFNYWGFKGGGPTVAGGYSCFSSPDEAVDAVGARIEKLVNRGVNSPAQMISWKCGSSCAGHGAENVRKWIADVAINFYKINS